MPIFDYACKACGHEFEVLVLPSVKTAPSCPQCHSEDLEKLLSGFAVNTPEMSRARVKAAQRQIAQSKNTRDRTISDQDHVREHVKEYLGETGQED